MNTIFGALDLQASLGSLSVTATVVGGGLLLAFIALALIFEKRTTALKIPIFTAICVVVIATTSTLAFCASYLATQSPAGGMAHWQARYQIWVCGNRLELRDPQTFVSNKIGSASLHEHNDSIIHLEGTPSALPYDFSLGKFMAAVGGAISNNSLVVPVNDSGYFVAGNAPAPELTEPYVHTDPTGTVASVASGDPCGDQTAAMQAFAYRYNESTNAYQQTKIADIAAYEPSHATKASRSDCIIIEFGPYTPSTTHTCQEASS